MSLSDAAGAVLTLSTGAMLSKGCHRENLRSFVSHTVTVLISRLLTTSSADRAAEVARPNRSVCRVKHQSDAGFLRNSSSNILTNYAFDRGQTSWRSSTPYCEPAGCHIERGVRCNIWAVGSHWGLLRCSNWTEVAGEHVRSTSPMIKVFLELHGGRHVDLALHRNNIRRHDCSRALIGALAQHFEA